MVYEQEIICCEMGIALLLLSSTYSDPNINCPFGILKFEIIANFENKSWLFDLFWEAEISIFVEIVGL